MPAVAPFDGAAEDPEPALDPQQPNNGSVSEPDMHRGKPLRARLSTFFAMFARPKASTTVADTPSARPEPGDTSESPGTADGNLTKAAKFNPVPPQAPAPDKSSAEIFVDIGQRLRARREMLSLTYEEIERHTHVRVPFLAALERGALDELPSPVQTRGILVNYTGFLDLDVDEILLLFADGLQARYREKGPQKPARTRSRMTVNTSLPPLRTFIASDLVFGGGLAITLLLFAIWGINRVMAVRSETAALATPPSISDVLAGTPLPTLVQQVTVIPADDTLAPAAAVAPSATLELATLDPSVNVQVQLAASERAYVRVMVDGKLKFEGRTEAGSTYTYQASNQIEIVSGNAAALRVTYNGHDLGLMGNFGQVVDRLYTAEGVATPTSTPPPTRTPTPRVTGTPTETITVTPSVTRTAQP